MLVELVTGLVGIWIGHLSCPLCGGCGLRRRSKGCSTPCRSPGSLQTHSRRRWCHSPCHTAGHSHRTPLTHSSSRNMSHHPRRNRRWHSPARCYTELRTHKKGRPEYSEHSSLGRNTDRVSEVSEFLSSSLCIFLTLISSLFFGILLFFYVSPSPLFAFSVCNKQNVKQSSIEK